jgi:Spy/CpxP family protein refolding chaperone
MQSKNARLEAAVLVLVVFMLGLLLGGVGSHLWDERVLGETAAIKTNPTRNDRVNGLTQRLQLTPDQQKQIGATIDETLAKWKALYTPLDDQREAIRQQGRANIRAVLTPEQQVKFDEFLKQLDEQRRKEKEAAAKQ